ncbi:MAG TPA: toll/interleukin-1 receptor domain-containing protein [Patescibacteria group bacterium]|nr:toll/interleukin-1 receptor domain-containing protein [Patescibacteria group bacterium]
MADICVIFATEDKELVNKLVFLLREHWEVWWSGDISQGDWEPEVLRNITNSTAVVPVFSRHTQQKKIFKDELKITQGLDKFIFPFFIENVDPPLGFGGLDRTYSIGWKGEGGDSGYLELKKKIATNVEETRSGDKDQKRISTLELSRKKIKLPFFMFSLSSHETQVLPGEGVRLLKFLEPEAILVSAYDAWEYKNGSNISKKYYNNMRKLRRSNSVVCLDSGNYEAYRQRNHYSEKNKDGWRQSRFREMVNEIAPDLVFTYDKADPTGGFSNIIKSVISNYCDDVNSVSSKDVTFCPIIHLPRKYKGKLATYAARIITKVALELNPIMLAVPERELGIGLTERFKTVQSIRASLNKLGRYYPLHLLGTGNPLSIIVLASAGADSFDGLEWCRTVVDYENGYLFHFQQFDFFKDTYFSRIRSPKVRKIIENKRASYSAQVASYNFDYFNDLLRTVRDMIYSGQVEHLLKSVPKIGNKLFQGIQN